MQYYSIQFDYDAACRGVSVPGLHISYSVDEDAENRLLSRVEKVAYNAAKTVGLKLHYQYCWPDGSCYQWATAESAEEFEAKFERLKRILRSPWMSVSVRPSAIVVEDPALAHGCACHLTLIDRIAGKPTLYYDHEKFEALEPKTAWGGYSNSDWIRYRERHAFEDGFKCAFGHYADFWHGGHEGYVPSVRAQELAGTGYALGRLFKLLNYT